MSTVLFFVLSFPIDPSFLRCASPSVRGSGRRRGRGLASNASSTASAFHSWNVELESEKSAEGSLLPTSEVSRIARFGARVAAAHFVGE